VTTPAVLTFAEACFTEEQRRKVREGKLMPIEPHDWPGVYVIRSGEFVKIGSARNIALRFADIQCCNPNELELLAVLSEDRSHERLFHRMFEAHHVRGEWFHLRGEVVDAVLIARARLEWKPECLPGEPLS
jgi:hypothetical protein